MTSQIFAIGIAMSLLSVWWGSACAKDHIMLEDLAISPDGRTVAFQFSPALDGPHGIGLYDWESGKLVRIPNPEGKQIAVPSFSYDGKRLAVVIADRDQRIWTDIAVVDLSTMKTTQLTFDHENLLEGKTSPVFQPRTGNILYVEGGIGINTHIKMFDVEAGNNKMILDKVNGFSLNIFRPYFVEEDEIYFLAIGPVDKLIKKDLKESGSPVVSTIAYRLHFGEKPSILFPEIERNRNDLKLHVHRDLGSLTVSENGREMYFIDCTNYDKGERYNYDLFKIQNNGHSERVTFLDSFLSNARVSYDGSVVAFFNDLARQRDLRLRRYDLMIFDTKNSLIKKTDLLERIESIQGF